MQAVSYLIAAILGLFGFIFIAGNQGYWLRWVIGLVLLAAAAALIYLSRMRPQVIQQQSTVVHQVDLTGDVSLEKMACKNCGAPLSNKSVEVKAGAIFVNCEHCGTSYQIEEAPKW